MEEPDDNKNTKQTDGSLDKFGFSKEVGKPETKVELLGEDDLIQEDKSKKEYLIFDPEIKIGKKGIIEIERGRLMLIASQTGVAKTWVSLDMSMKIGSGGLVFNKFNTTKSKVLYIDLENGRDELARRYWRLTDKKSGNFYHITNNEVKEDGKIIIINNISIDSPNSNFKAFLLKKIKEDGYGLVIIDPLIFISEGDENDTKDMRDLFKILKKIIFETKVAILVNHHINKGKYADEIQQIRGNSAIVGMCDYIYFLKKHKEDDEEAEEKGEELIEVMNLKNRGGARKPTFIIGLYDSYDNKNTFLIYEGLLKQYKTNKIYRCKADILRLIKSSTVNGKNYVETGVVIETLKDKYNQKLIESAISELKDDSQIFLFNNERGKLTF